MYRTCSFLLSLAATALVSGKLEAQTAQAISFQVSGLYNGVFGDVFDGLNNGVGAEAQLRYTPGALSLGAGFQYTAHTLDPEISARIFTDNAKLYGGFFEPRYRIHTGSNVVAPYVSARFSLLKMGFSDGDLSLSSTFMQLNGGGGLLYRMGPRFNLDLGATYGYNRLGPGRLSSEENGINTNFDSSSGSNIVVRLGLAVGLGG